MQLRCCEKLQFALKGEDKMKLTLLLIVCCCLFGLAFGNQIVATKPPFIRSRYSLRWRKTTTVAPEASTASAINAVTTTTHHPKLATSTANADYDYYGNGEAENVVHK
ncbi:uncharacterized protein LOC128259373 [Drosophila gunungcola]|uniref:Uncharacterized protein n=1 Tax=Drosophila gunungcola TaxID=103775 RepID=A0A9Q0BUN6_9MUSC|nr:uncharacterized protein LOC128259373 [Drosophila gunungcola]KAI8044856.1 hypothetical protein M5D96_001031 [Drosophila gunungcola]